MDKKRIILSIYFNALKASLEDYIKSIIEIIVFDRN
jgi:hypothetical protein